MSGQGLAMVENELGFLWDDQQNQFSWENLSNKSSGGGGEEEDKPVGEKKNLGSDGGSKGNYKKSEEGPASNKKRSRGGGCKKKKNTNFKKSVDQNENINGGNNAESDHEIHIWTERERRKKMRNMFSNLHALLPQLPSKADKSTIVDEAVTYIKALEETFTQLKKQKLEKLNNGASPSTTTTTTSNVTSAFACEPSSSTSLLTLPQVNKPSNYNSNINDAINTREAYLADHNNDLMTMGIINNNNNNNNNNLQVQSQSNVPVTFQTWASSNVVLNISGNEAHINVVCSPNKKPGLFSSICYVLEKNKISLVSAQLSSDGVRYMFMIHARANSSETSDQFVEAFNYVEGIFKQAVGEIMYWISS